MNASRDNTPIQVPAGVLREMLGTPAQDTGHVVERLHGGTLGDVYRVTGTAQTEGGAIVPYRAVYKRQKQWERPGDPDSWRREYDLYRTGLGRAFSDALRWPACYRAEMDGDSIRIWMEYIEGASGNDLTPDMLEDTALALGRLEGMLYARPELLVGVDCLGDPGYLRRDYLTWHHGNYTQEYLVCDACRIPAHVKQITRGLPWVQGRTLEYNYLRSDACAISQQLKRMLTDIDDHLDDVFGTIARLPVVLCHRDVWLENIFYLNDGQIRLIDWDTAGFGYLGEDVASLIADDIDYDHFGDYCRRLIPAYYRGVSEHMDLSGIKRYCIREMILIKFGYRMVQAHLFAASDVERAEAVRSLECISAMDAGVYGR